MDANYPIRIFADNSSDHIYWVVEYPDLPGCIGVGDTPEEALIEGEIHKNLWLEAAQEIGEEIPEPNNMYSKDYSGRFNVRIPKSLHRELVLRADSEGTSLNSLVQAILAHGVHNSFSSMAECLSYCKQ